VETGLFSPPECNNNNSWMISRRAKGEQQAVEGALFARSMVSDRFKLASQRISTATFSTQLSTARLEMPHERQEKQQPRWRPLQESTLLASNLGTSLLVTTLRNTGGTKISYLIVIRIICCPRPTFLFLLSHLLQNLYI
jgi:hypothetical protein